MTAAVGPVPSGQVQPVVEMRDLGPAQSRWRQVLRSRRVVLGGGILLFILLLCLVTLRWTLSFYTVENDAMARQGPNMQSVWGWFGFDMLGRSILARSLFGGTISLAVGLAAASISIVLGVAVGLLAGYRGGWVDAGLMRIVDILYGLPYVLLVILFKVAFEGPLEDGVTWRACFGLLFFLGMLMSVFSAGGKTMVVKLALFGLGGILLLVTVLCWWPGGSAPTVKSAAATSTTTTSAATHSTTTTAATTTKNIAATNSVAAASGAGAAATRGATTATAATAPASTQEAASQPVIRTIVGNDGIAFKLSPQAASLVVLFSAIGLVSWLTMARVVRGQVLSLRGQPFIEACRAMGVREGRIFLRHILPNLIGPITVYATLTVPSAILQESFLSFLGVGVNPPLATWGSLASEGVEKLSPLKFYWWLLVFPCSLLAITLLSLNFLGDGLRDVFDPKKEAAKI